MTPVVAVIDALSSLLEAEHNSLFRFLGPGSPYVSPAIAEVRPRVRGMIDAGEQNARELAAAIEAAGGAPDPRRVPGEEQYIAYLSLKFLLPKLVEAKELLVRRYENALRLGTPLPADIRATLERHLAGHRADVETLRAIEAR